MLKPVQVVISVGATVCLLNQFVEGLRQLYELRRVLEIERYRQIKPGTDRF